MPDLTVSASVHAFMQSANAGSMRSSIGLDTADSPAFAGLTSPTLASSGALALSAGGSNQNVTLSGSGTGVVTTASRLTVTNATNATSTSTGALVVTGGMAVGNNLHVAGNCVFPNVTAGPTGFFGMSGRALMQAGVTPTRMFFTDSGFSTRVPLDCAGLILTKTITAGGTTGNQTINQYAGSVNFAAAATSLTVTNSLVTANSLIFVSLGTNDATAQLGAVVAGAGSFVIHMSAAPTAETRVNFLVNN